MKYPVFIINLDRQPDRMAFMKQQLAALDIEARRISAFDGRDPSCKGRDCAAWYASLTPGEIGCFESHRTVWKTLVDENIPAAIVLEDDIVLASDLSDLDFDVLADQPCDLVKLDQDNILHDTRLYGTAKTPCGAGRHVVRMLGDEFCTGGYFITLSGAQKLLGASRHYFAPVDRFMYDQDSKAFASLTAWKLEDAAIVQTRALFPEEGDDDSISAARSSGHDATGAHSFVRQTAIRLRRFLDGDMRKARQARVQRLKETLARHEALEERKISFRSASLSHVPAR